MHQKPKRELLRGWGAISEHLGIPERTLMEWAKLEDNDDMPLLKFGNQKHSQVAAYVDKLDEWFAKFLKPRRPSGKNHAA